MIKRLEASIMTADQLNLGLEIQRLKAAGISWLHCDVMDGVFVNNLAMGPYQIERLKEDSDLTLDIHLATENPQKYIDLFSPYKPDYITFHVEVADDPQSLINELHGLGVKAGIALTPESPLELIEPYLNEVDLILIMTVNPGFAGQPFNYSVLTKLDQLTDCLRRIPGNKPLVQVDGHINHQTISLMEDKEVNLFVLGTSALFNDNPGSYREKIDGLNKLLDD